MEEVIIEQPSIFRQLINYTIKIVALIHQYIMSLNDKYEMFLSDKMLHFIVIGLMGMFFLFIVYPIFKYLADNHKLVFVAWIYVFTILVAITLLIELGQDFSGTGDMDFADIVSGLFGFIVMSGVYLAIKEFINFIKKKDE